VAVTCWNERQGISSRSDGRSEVQSEEESHATTCPDWTGRGLEFGNTGARTKSIVRATVASVD
jgi:hypothetical protein